MGQITNPQVLNSAIEIGMRLSIILDAFYPKFLNVNQLLILDYMLIYRGDFKTTQDYIQPMNQLRTSELASKRTLITNALMLYQSRGIITSKISDSEILYRSGPRGSIFVQRLQSSYAEELKSMAKTMTIEETDISYEHLFAKWKDATAQIRGTIKIPLLEELNNEFCPIQ